MANNYRKFLKILESWPVDPSKTERDIGFHLRERVKKAFTAGELFQGDEEKCAREHASLKRLADNVYGKLYKRTISSSATGLTAEQCNSVLSSEFLDLLQKENRSIFSRLFRGK
ncbi:ubiquinol-cytochrome-c reductase complex assembly factor 2 [Schistocerca nitens]|uniref:ubiquinol-cytochrome-c reductase complex assembly factor 2 n=1 Tax=Schistocerca nitens TaxID=7011 RepID=UPI002118A605|nr:ubiquinol-cytochrome-c reductase complex assembly factor 2 [Schistocerca nitens]